jgi:hypothetical protein
MHVLLSRIYGYLLDNKYTRSPRSIDHHGSNIEQFHSGTIAYKFHTNVLAVNRAIRSEAEELMYKRNVFVVVSYQWHESVNSSFKGGLAWVPMVSKNLVSRMRRHSARIHISQSSGALAAYAQNTGPTVPLNAYIILADDIETMCTSVHYSVANAEGPYLQLTQDPSPAKELFVQEQDITAKPTQFKCELRDTEYRLMDSPTQHRILAPFASVIGPSQRVTFTGRICDQTEIAHLRRIMGPSTSCHLARWASLIENFSRAKRLAEDALKTDDLAYVLCLYKWITDAIVSLVFQPDLRRWVIYYCPRTVVDMCKMCLKIMLNIACGTVKMGDFDGCARALEYFTQVGQLLFEFCEDIGESIDDATEDINAYCFSIQMWVLIHGTRKPGQPPITRTVKETVQRLENLVAVTSGPQLEHLKHDWEVLERFRNQNVIICKESWPLDQCSATQMPLPFTSSLELTGSFAQRDFFEGWQDVDFLHSLDQKDKTNINRLQRARGLPITDFDQIALSREALQRKKTEA